MRPINCEVCETEVIPTSPRQKYCEECAREKIRQYDKERHKPLYLKNRSRYLMQSKEWNAKIRLDALTYYSLNKSPECECCGENTIEFLVIDHKNGGGARHRREINGEPIYIWLKRNDYPDGFRVLCHNCNSALGSYGYCPHEEVKV